ncbi:MAG: hypothetical protein ACRDWI_16840 [Jiangellaceae bacterium]
MNAPLDRRTFLGRSMGLAAGVGVLGVAGCAADEGSTGAAATPKPSATVGDAELRMAWWGGGARHERNVGRGTVVREVPAGRGDPRVRRLPGVLREARDADVRRQAPDIFQILQEYVPDYGTRNQLLDLEPYLGFEKQDLVDLHLHLDVRRLPQPAHLPVRPGEAHGPAGAAALPRRDGRVVVGTHVGHVQRLIVEGVSTSGIKG